MHNTPLILYVEDEKSLQVTLSRMLEHLGYTVVCANNGQAGVDKAQLLQPDVILMDIRMPVLDGMEAARLLRASPATSHIPIYILSAYTDAKIRKQCDEVGVDGFFSKPPELTRLDSAIKKVLAKRSPNLANQGG
jgi:CheY-like chemotaxis protein